MKTKRKVSSIASVIHHEGSTPIAKVLLSLLLLMGISLQGFAKLVTHEWEARHRGYSVELVPGTDVQGVAAEYVAAGTRYDEETTSVAWHFMHLDANGNVLDERTTWAHPSYTAHEFRVVDIAVQSADAYWITVQVKGIGAYAGDFIYLAGVDLNGNDLATNPAIAIKSNSGSYSDLYPTHSYFASNGSIYICGYAANGTAWPGSPDKFNSDKYGMFLKCNVATKAVNSFFWDTYYDPIGLGGKDFDMALKIAPNEYGEEFPLLVTGAAGVYNDGWLSAALLAKFDANAQMVDMDGVLPIVSAVSYEFRRPTGVYGVDIRGGVYGGYGNDPEPNPYDNPDIIVLVNKFDDGIVGEEGDTRGTSPKKMTYGIVRVMNNFNAYDPMTNASFMYLNSPNNAWGKQFLELHGQGKNQHALNHVPVIGEIVKLHKPLYEDCTQNLPSGALTPSFNNVNPFYSMAFVAAQWDYTTGFGGADTRSLEEPRVYLSSKGTRASNLDYYQGTLGGGAIMEDVTRLHTFTSLTRHYDNPNVRPPEPGHAMVLPIGESNTPSLKTKYLKVNSIFQETECNKYIRNCASVSTSATYNSSFFTYPSYEGMESYDASTIFTFINQFNNIPSTTGCTTGYYKPTGIAQAGSANEITLFPNPTVSELNIGFGTGIEGGYDFVLTDVTGKVVYQQSGIVAGGVKVQLPSLSIGMYIATVTTDTKAHTEKISIQ